MPSNLILICKIEPAGAANDRGGLADIPGFAPVPHRAAAPTLSTQPAPVIQCPTDFGTLRDGLEVILSHTRGIASPTIRREMRRRNGIEPVIGHMKDDGLLERNHLLGAEGDAINAILCAAGHNLRLLATWLALLIAFLIASIRDRRLGRQSSEAIAFAI
jgi:hypothetical protein